MRLIRFMCSDEFEKLMNGETLVNEKDHSLHSRTTSKGFCFFEQSQWDDEMTEEDTISEIEQILEYARGIVSQDYVVVFDSGNTKLDVGYGVYASPWGGWFDTINVKELSTKTYNKHSLTPLFYAKNPKLWGMEKINLVAIQN